MEREEKQELLSIVRMYVMDRRNGDYNEAMEAIDRLEKEFEEGTEFMKQFFK